LSNSTALGTTTGVAVTKKFTHAAFILIRFLIFFGTHGVQVNCLNSLISQLTG